VPVIEYLSFEDLGLGLVAGFLVAQVAR